MSGGSLWRFEVTPRNEVWSPSGVGKIVGVQSSWNQVDALFVESVSAWGDWFREVVAQVDRESK